MKTALFLVHWHVILLSATCFGLWYFFLRRSGLQWPMGPSIFCVVQGVLSFPLIVYYFGKHDGMVGYEKWVFLAFLASLATLFVLQYLLKLHDPNLQMRYALYAGALGVGGLMLLTNEMERINSLGDIGDKIRGLTLASTVALETIVMIVYHFWDVRKTDERITLHQGIAILMICGGIFLLFVRKNVPKNNRVVVPVEEMHTVSG